MWLVNDHEYNNGQYGDKVVDIKYLRVDLIEAQADNKITNANRIVFVIPDTTFYCPIISDTESNVAKVNRIQTQQEVADDSKDEKN